MEVPPLPFINKVVDNPFVAQRQISMVRIIQKTTETPQSQCIGEMIDVPVVSVVQVPRVCAVKKTAEIPQLQVVDVPVVLVVQAPLVQVRVVKETVEDPQFQIVEKSAEAPQTQTIQATRTSESLGIECDEGHELMLQGNDSVSAAEDVEDDANEVSEKFQDCMVRSSASGSTRQQQATSNHTDSTRERAGQRRKREGKKGSKRKRPGRDREGRKGVRGRRR